jgi:uncharacterized protein (TIGR03118 family)
MKLRLNKNMSIHVINQFMPKALLIASVLIAFPGCKKNDNNNNSVNNNYKQVNLVADTTGYGASRIDSNLVNAWGIAQGSSGALWISSNEKGLTVIYDASGNQTLAPVSIHFQGSDAAPTGVVFNSTSSFAIPSNGAASKFIYVTEDGALEAWASGDSTITVADRSAWGSVYKGIAIANDGTGNFIYATNFKNGKIDVFDQSFNYVSNKPFTDPNIPAGYAPFGIANIGGKLYVTYAKQKAPDNKDDEAGTGNGYVDIYNTDGSLEKRFASQGTLNSPWGISYAPSDFGLGNNWILIGNFGDGHINIYNSNGDYQGQLKNESGAVLTIEGLWAITTISGDHSKLYFTAGPADEDHGLFGYLMKK